MSLIQLRLITQNGPYHTPSDPVGREDVPCYGAAMHGEKIRHGLQERAEGRGGFEMSRLVAMGWKSADTVEALAGWAAWIGFGGCAGRVGGVVPCCGAFDLDFLQ